MPVYTDQLGRWVDVPATPRSIVSLVPSITELLYTLQLDDQVTGITKFCVHPESWFRQKNKNRRHKEHKRPMLFMNFNPILLSPIKKRM